MLNVETSGSATKDEGRILEMTPVTQIKSVEDGSSGSDGDETRLGGNSWKGSRAAGYDDFAVRNAAADDDDDGVYRSGSAGDSAEEGHRLLSSHRANDQHPGFAGERGHIDHVHDSFHRNARCARDVEEVEVADELGHGDAGQRRRRRSACWQECLVPAKLLQEERIRAILFVYAIFSVRI